MQLKLALLVALVCVLAVTCDARSQSRSDVRARRLQLQSRVEVGKYDHFTKDECDKKFKDDDKKEYDELLKEFSGKKIPAKKCDVKDGDYCKNKPLFIITYGPSSSGKGYLLEQVLPKLYGVGSKEDAAKCFLGALVDDMIEASPRFKSKKKTYAELRDVGSCVNDRLVDEAIKKKVDVVFETIGKSSMKEKYMTEFIPSLAKDFCLTVFYPFVEPETIKTRLDERNKKGLRQVDWGLINKEHIPQAQGVFLEYCKKFKMHCVLFNNNGKDPTPVFRLKADGAKCLDEKYICAQSKIDADKVKAEYKDATASGVKLFKAIAEECKLKC